MTNLTELSHKHNALSVPYPIVPSISFHSFNILAEAFSMLFTHITPIWFEELSCKHKKHTSTHMLHTVANTAQSNLPNILASHTLILFLPRKPCTTNKNAYEAFMYVGVILSSKPVHCSCVISVVQ